MSGDPAGVGGAPEAVFVVDIEDIFERGIGAHHVAAVRVQDGLGLAGGAGGIQDEERVFGVHHFGGAFAVGDRQRAQVVIPVVAPGFHRHLVAGAFDDDHVFHARAVLEGLVHDALEFHQLAVLNDCRRR